MAFVGTLNEITLISEVDGNKLDVSGVLKGIAERYRSVVHGLEAHPAVDMDCRPSGQLLGAAAE
jgi:hypothetical protein